MPPPRKIYDISHSLRAGADRVQVPQGLRWSRLAGAVIIGFMSLMMTGCGTGSNEEYREERGRTLYRSADHSGNEEPPSLPQRKVPGE